MRPRRTFLASALLAILLPAAARADDEGSIWTPPLPRRTTMASFALRPFLHLVGPGWGGLADGRVTHYFRFPLALGVELAPLALVVERGTGGYITHARLYAGYADDFLELGLGLGGRLQRWGPDGFSMAASLRLGALDGLNGQLRYAYSLVQNPYRRERRWAIASVAATVAVPVHRRVRVEIDGSLGFDLWIHATAGLRHRLWGDGRRGTLDLRAGAGLVFIEDRFPCIYGDPTPCLGAAVGFGPTLMFGVDRRF
jgi:hypothetical protein